MAPVTNSDEIETLRLAAARAGKAEPPVDWMSLDDANNAKTTR